MDEPKKVQFIKKNVQDFQHPVLMLQASRVVNSFTGFEIDRKIVLLGRTLSGIFGTLTVFCIYLISRNILSKRYSLLVALGTAVSPILVVHSHYLKEDAYLTCFSLLALFFLFRYIRKLNLTSSFLLGVSIGLAMSSHYRGMLLILVCIAAPLVISIQQKASYFKFLCISVFIALGVFLVINYPLFFHFEMFKKGFLLEMNHAIQGHYLRIYPFSHFFGFHLFHSIIPGMSLFLSLCALWYMMYLIFNWRKTECLEDKVLFLYTIIFYFAVEISPLKPTDFMRYVMPIIPGLIYFAYRGIRTFCFTFFSSIPVIHTAIIITSIAIPLYSSAQLDYYLDRDTRYEAEQWIRKKEKKAKYEPYTLPTHYDVISITKLNIPEERNNNISYLVTSSFVYDTVAFGSTLKNQDTKIYKAQKDYERLFNEYPFVEIKPGYKTFAFSNPTIRIIDISRDE